MTGFSCYCYIQINFIGNDYALWLCAYMSKIYVRYCIKVFLAVRRVVVSFAMWLCVLTCNMMLETIWQVISYKIYLQCLSIYKLYWHHACIAQVNKTRSGCCNNIIFAWDYFEIEFVNCTKSLAMHGYAVCLVPASTTCEENTEAVTK
jgi:hypothetical protein